MRRRRSDSESTEKIINALFATSFGTAVIFTLTNDISKAIVGYSISFFFSLFTSYGKRFSEVFQERLQVWAERDARAFADFLSYGRQSLHLNLSRFEYQYFQCLKVSCTEIEIEGLDDLAPLNLARVYVPLKAEESHRQIPNFDLQLSEIWNYLPKTGKKGIKIEESPYRRILIVAGPGYGKTTLLRHLCLMYATSKNDSYEALKMTPILLRCREIYQLIQTESRPSLPDLIGKHIQINPDYYPDLNPPLGWFSEKLKNGNCLVMIDGIDEVPDALREKVRRWINFQMKSYFKNQFILTSRPHGVERPTESKKSFSNVEAVRFKILPFNSTQKTNFIYQWYSELFFIRYNYYKKYSKGKGLETGLYDKILDSNILKKASIAAKDLIRELIQNPALNKLAENPLLITMIVNTYQADKALARRREELYNQMCNLSLEGRPRKKGTPLSLGAWDSRAILQTLALKLVYNQRSQFSIQTGSEIIRKRIIERSGENLVEPKKFLEEIHEISGLLIGKEGGVYEFIHKTFQEYLCSTEIKSLGLEKYMLEKIDDKGWMEVIRFYAAQYGAKEIVSEAIKKNTPEAISFAYKIVEEDGSYVESGVRKNLYSRIEKMHIALGELAPRLRLSQRFKKAHKVDHNRLISENPITWGEYRLFLEDQFSGQFHSKAKKVDFTKHSEDKPVRGVSWQDAQWFCAWLVTQSKLQQGSGTYDFTLPSPQEIDFCRKGELKPLMNSPKIFGDTIFIVRVSIPNEYKTLIGYLANNCWQEADEETARIMLKTFGKDREDSLDIKEIEEFPCHIIQIIDELWKKFSGLHFGFGVQAKAYLECGNSLKGDFEPDKFETFRVELGWPQNGALSSLHFALDAPRGHLPWLRNASSGYWLRVRKVLRRVSSCVSL